MAAPYYTTYIGLHKFNDVHICAVDSSWWI